jgi:hypothetical protein
MNSKAKEHTPAETANAKFGCRISGLHCCVRCLCGSPAFFGEMGTSRNFRIKDNSMQCPRVLSSTECYDYSPSVLTVVLAASACTGH